MRYVTIYDSSNIFLNEGKQAFLFVNPGCFWQLSSLYGSGFPLSIQ